MLLKIYILAVQTTRTKYNEFLDTVDDVIASGTCAMIMFVGIRYGSDSYSNNETFSSGAVSWPSKKKITASRF